MEIGSYIYVFLKVSFVISISALHCKKSKYCNYSITALNTIILNTIIFVITFVK